MDIPRIKGDWVNQPTPPRWGLPPSQLEPCGVSCERRKIPSSSVLARAWHLLRQSHKHLSTWLRINMPQAAQINLQLDWESLLASLELSQACSLHHQQKLLWQQHPLPPQLPKRLCNIESHSAKQ
jgi:hypothetical protein